MGKHRFWWSVPVKDFVRVIQSARMDSSPIAEMVTKAYDDAREQTLKMHNGDLRMQLVERVLIRKEFELTNSDLHLYVPERTACRWMNDFVRLVGIKMGFTTEDPDRKE